MFPYFASSLYYDPTLDAYSPDAPATDRGSASSVAVSGLLMTVTEIMHIVCTLIRHTRTYAYVHVMCVNTGDGSIDCVESAAIVHG